MRPTAAEIAEAAARLSGAEPAAILGWALAHFTGRIAIASSFSIEDCVVIDLAHAIDPAVRVVALDTGRLPDETYVCAERVRAKYGVTIEWQFPDRKPVERLEREKGLFSFRDSLANRRECCGIRKVVPLGRALANLDAWVTGVRREQSVTRADTPEIELDAGHAGLGKINPIVAWSEAQVRAYATERHVPIHALHDRGYPSIGCAPCTRAVAPGDHPRSGRWWWENPENKECGIHTAG